MKHPVHPLVVHFPIACWSLSTLGDLTGIVFSHNQAQAIVILMFIGCISAIVAMAAGLYEVGKINNIDPILTTVDRHMYAAVTAWCFYSLSLYLRWHDGFSNDPNSWAIISSVIGLVSLIIAGWYGANLVYQHGMGTTQDKLAD
ncbi:MAG: DUF2231 domain-containing protein [Gammaproteobacteria bacterium]